MKPLSICIPTYNRAAFLRLLLESIFAQKTEDIEVIVSDNNSTDSTAETVKTYLEKHPNLFYFKNKENLGFDGNMLAVVSRAKGRYCWVIGDDDTLKPGSIEYVLEQIKTGFAFYAVSADLCDGNLKCLQYGSYIKRAKDGEVFSLARKRDILAYLKRVKANMGLFGYIGGAVFKKELWDKVSGADKVLGGGWVHVFMLWSFKNFGASFKFLQKPLVNIRMHNDTIIKSKGIIARLITEFKGLMSVADAVFEDKEERRAFLAAVCRYVNPNSIPPLFLLTEEDKKHWPEFVEIIKKYPYAESFKKTLNSRLRVNPVYFIRIFLNKPAMRLIKKPFKFFKDLICG